MRLPDDYEEQPKLNMAALKMIIGVSLFIVAVLVLVLIMNSDDTRPKGNNAGNQSANASTSAGNGEDADTIVPGTLSPDDFDFWDMYPEVTATPIPAPLVLM